jgi:hypothetical protein
MHAADLGINVITRVLLVYTCQRGVCPRGHVLPLRLPVVDHRIQYLNTCILRSVLRTWRTRERVRWERH